MRLSRKQRILAERLLSTWVDEELLTREHADRLSSSISQKTLNWKRVARNMLGLAIIFMVIAFLHLVADKWVIQFLESFFAMSDAFFLVLLLSLSMVFPFLARYFHRKGHGLNLSVETFLLLGLLAFSGAAYYTNAVFQPVSVIKVLLILVVSAYTLVVSFLFRDKLMWLLGLVGVMLWFGVETVRLSNWETSFLGLNLPVRFLIFTSFLALASNALSLFEKFRRYSDISIHFFLMMMWVSLWMTALFGNYSSMEAWDNASAFQLLPWGVLMGVVAFIFWFMGKKRHHKEWIWMGSIALFADVYTQYFLFLWEPLPASLFFFVMALSFLVIGRKAEVIWGS
ncbi:hypothetical protein [Alkaliflexus imshenetskii]|uniref:hypothetical protein n=1 Tax=Alkaliflexus imshenetskii TaxID=286730 RepID=UPI00047D4F2B|nr:hypothetical protein [Alkaliflexus imshenetskii]